jgi:hypothetical protein
MIESIIFTASAIMLTWPAILIVCVFGVLSEHNESRGMAMFWGLVAAISAFFYFNVPLQDLLTYAVSYVVIGLLWSFYRYKRFITAKVEEFEKNGYIYDGWDKVQNLDKWDPSKMLDTITCWIIIWPFSLLDNMCADIIVGIEALVKKVFKGVYKRIFASASARVNYIRDGN